MKPWLLGLAIAASLPAQTLQGLVVDRISGQPVAGVYVRIPPIPGVERPLSVTDKGGRFRFENVPPNLRTFLDFIRSGYVGGSRTLATKSDPAANFVRLEMTPQAVISGKIEDEDVSSAGRTCGIDALPDAEWPTPIAVLGRFGSAQ